jgi:transposase
MMCHTIRTTGRYDGDLIIFTTQDVNSQWEASEEGHRLGRATHAITWGHNKDHRPDLKQLLYTLTVSHDGGVPVYFTSHSGNVVDDKTHCATWDLLCQLVGGPDFLYVADCKVASRENLRYIARTGRFVTVMPRTHGKDKTFRKQCGSLLRRFVGSPCTR